MKKILTKETKDNLMFELLRIEKVAVKNTKIQDTYFPHTLYEVWNIMDKAIWLEIEYWDNNK